MNRRLNGEFGVKEIILWAASTVSSVNLVCPVLFFKVGKDRTLSLVSDKPSQVVQRFDFVVTGLGRQRPKYVHRLNVLHQAWTCWLIIFKKFIDSTRFPWGKSAWRTESKTTCNIGEVFGTWKPMRLDHGFIFQRLAEIRVNNDESCPWLECIWCSATSSGRQRQNQRHSPVHHPVRPNLDWAPE